MRCLPNKVVRRTLTKNGTNNKQYKQENNCKSEEGSPPAPDAEARE